MDTRLLTVAATRIREAEPKIHRPAGKALIVQYLNTKPTTRGVCREHLPSLPERGARGEDDTSAELTAQVPKHKANYTQRVL